MSSLSQLLASHRRILIVDAASTRVQVGLLQRGADARWHTATEEAGRAVFSGTAAVLGEAGLNVEEVDAFAFCEGPGSMLGVRTVAMALRTWHTLRPRPMYAYQSLALAAWGEHAVRPRGFHVIADARRESWHCQGMAAGGELAPLERRLASALPSGELLMPAGFRAWAPPPAGTATCPYDLATILPRVEARGLFRESPAPDAHQHDAPEYRKWSAQVHSAETRRQT